jgi:hypothetical protein
MFYFFEFAAFNDSRKFEISIERKFTDRGKQNGAYQQLGTGAGEIDDSTGRLPEVIFRRTIFFEISNIVSMAI